MAVRNNVVHVCPDSMENVGDGVPWRSWSLGSVTFHRDDVTLSTLNVSRECCATTAIDSDFTIDADAWTLTHTRYGTVSEFCVSPVAAHVVACLRGSARNPFYDAEMTGKSLSVLFMLLLIAVMILLRRVGNIFGVATLFVNTSLTLQLIASLIIQYITDSNYTCLGTAGYFTTLYFTLALVTWMMIMCIDVFRRCRRRRSALPTSRLWMIYCSIGWFKPLVLVISAQFVDILDARIKYDAAPNGALLAFSAGVLVWSAWIIYVKKGSNWTTATMDRSDFWLCVRLLSVTIVTYILVTIDNFAGGSEAFKNVASTVYSFQGVLYFLASVCTKDTLCQLREKYAALTTSQQTPETTNIPHERLTQPEAESKITEDNDDIL